MMPDSRRHSLFGPLLLIALGVILLLNTLNVIEGDTWSLIWRLWPLLLIVGGLDGFYRREGFVGSALLLGIGAVFLMSNLGYWNISSWELLLRFWPVLLIALGLDILIGRRSGVIGVLGVLLGLGLVAAILALMLLIPLGVGAVEAQPVSQPLQGVTRASVTVLDAVGELNLGAGAGSGRLVEGQVTASSPTEVRQEFTLNGGQGIYRLERQGPSAFYPLVGGAGRGRWELHLTPAIPLELSIRLLIGSQYSDLRQLKVERLESETVLGSNVLILPGDGRLNGHAKTVIGELVIRVPRQAAVRIQADTGITTLSLPQGYRKEGNLILSPEAGSAANVIELQVELPIGSLRVEYWQ